MVPGADVRRDIFTISAIGIPVFLYNAVGAQVLGRLTGQASPGLLPMVAAR